MKKNLSATLKQKLQRKQQPKNLPKNDLEVLYFTKSGNYERLCVLVSVNLCTDACTEVLLANHFIKLFIVPKSISLSHDNVDFVFTLTPLECSRILKYFIYTLRTAHSWFINVLIRLAYTYFSKTYFSDMIFDSILNSTAFIGNQSTVTEKNAMFMDTLDIISMQQIYDKIGDIMYDIIHVYKPRLSDDYVQDISLRQIIMDQTGLFKLDSRFISIALEESEKYGFDLKSHFDEVWRSKYSMEEEEDVDEVLEETEENE